MNTTNIHNHTLPSPDEPFTYIINIIQGSIYLPIFCAGIGNNVLTILIILLNPDMRTVTNCYLLNLAISDILPLIVSLPFEISVSHDLYMNEAKRFFTIFIISFYLLKFHGVILVVEYALFLLKLLQMHRY